MEKTSFTHTFWKFIADMERDLEGFFTKKAPALPQSGKELLATILPWLAVIGVIFLVPTLLLALGLSALLAPFSLIFNTFSTSSNYFSLFVSAIFSIAQIIILCLAIPGLFKRTKTAWNYLFVGQLLAFLHNVVTLSFLSLIVGFLIGMYLLFQIRPLYVHNKKLEAKQPHTPEQPTV